MFQNDIEIRLKAIQFGQEAPYKDYNCYEGVCINISISVFLNQE